VKAQLRHGRADGAACEVPNPPPETLRVEVFAEDVEETARPVLPGEEFPTIESEAHGYRLKGRIITEAGKEATTRIVTADYVYDESLDPKLIEHSVALEPAG
jgi:hypothetical protein